MAFPTLDSDTYTALEAISNGVDACWDEDTDSIIIHTDRQREGIVVSCKQIDVLESLGLIELGTPTHEDLAPIYVTERGYYQLRKQAKKQPHTIRIHGLGR